jgi:hypothetical protein
MSGDTNIVGFACWFERICFAVCGIDLICSMTDLSCCLFDRRERLGQTPFGSCWSLSSWYQIRWVSHGDFSATIYLLRLSICWFLFKDWRSTSPSVESLFVASSVLFCLHRSDPPPGVQRAHFALFRSISSDWIDPRSQACFPWSIFEGVPRLHYSCSWSRSGSIYPVSSYSTFSCQGQAHSSSQDPIVQGNWKRKKKGGQRPRSLDPILGLWSSEGLVSLTFGRARLAAANVQAHDRPDHFMWGSLGVHEEVLLCTSG